MFPKSRLNLKPLSIYLCKHQSIRISVSQTDKSHKLTFFFSFLPFSGIVGGENKAGSYFLVQLIETKCKFILWPLGIPLLLPRISFSAIAIYLKINADSSLTEPFKPVFSLQK